MGLAKSTCTRLYGFFAFLAKELDFLEVDFSRLIGTWDSLWLTPLCLSPCRARRHISCYCFHSICSWMIWVEMFENSSSGRIATLSLYIKVETITERAFQRLYRSRNPHWTGGASHFLCTQFIAFLLTDSFASSWPISSAVIGMFRMELARMLRISFSMATLAMTVFCIEVW